MATKESAKKTKAVKKEKKSRKTSSKPKAKAAAKKIDIGIDVRIPQDTCEDVNCPFHGTLPVRGQIIKGTVVTAKMDKTIVVRKEQQRLIPKYERYEKRTHKYLAHNPPCIELDAGDEVTIMECRPLSKGVKYVTIEGGGK